MAPRDDGKCLRRGVFFDVRAAPARREKLPCVMRDDDEASPRDAFNGGDFVGRDLLRRGGDLNPRRRRVLWPP